jgi:hypothetical protein
MNKFEQLIEYVINDDEANAKALFHEIVVDKSRDIYEEIMAEEESEASGGQTKHEFIRQLFRTHFGQPDYNEMTGGRSGMRRLKIITGTTRSGYPNDQQQQDTSAFEKELKAAGLDQVRVKADPQGKAVTVLYPDDFRMQSLDEAELVEKDIEYDMEESEELGGSQVDDLIDDIESEEQGATFEDDDEEEIEMIDIDVDDDNGEEELEDRVVDIEDKLDELMSEFEELMGQVDDNTDDIDGEQDEISDIDGDIDGIEGEMDEPIDIDVEVEGFNENVDLVPAPKPVTTSPASKSPYAVNSGQKGMDAKPVNFDDGNKGKEGRPTPKYVSQDNTTKPDVKPATKPNLAQASGVNTKSVID